MVRAIALQSSKTAILLGPGLNPAWDYDIDSSKIRNNCMLYVRVSHPFRVGLTEEFRKIKKREEADNKKT